MCWGLIPLYFRAVAHCNKYEILAHRIVWSVGLMLMVVTLSRGWGPLRAAFASRKIVLTMLLSSLLLAFNWLIYIHAVTTQRTVEASLGYYMMPLVYAFLATIFLGEKLRRAHWPALGIIAVGVSIPFIVRQDFTWIAVVLPVSFGFYGLVRKTTAVDSATGLTVETLLLGIPSLVYIALLGTEGKFDDDTPTAALLMLGGVVTAVPLLTYTLSIRRLPLLALNFIQFLSPTMQMIVGVYVFEEPMSWDRWVAMGCVWVAVVIFIFDAVWKENADPADPTRIKRG